MSQTEQRLQKRYEFGSFTLELNPLCLFQNGVEVPIRSKGREILLLLVENAGRMIEKEEILNRVWPERAVEESNLSQHVHLLRRALEGDTRSQDYILTIPGKGYLFNHEVRIRMGTPSRPTLGSTDQLTSPADLPLDDSVEETILSPRPPTIPPTGLLDRRRLPSWTTKRLLPLTLGVVLIGGIFVWWRWQERLRSPGMPVLSSGVILPMVTLTGKDTYPSFSPDGQFLAFSSNGDGSGNRNIYLQRVEDGRLTQLTSDRRADIQPNWSPDSSQIAFLREATRSGYPYDVMIVPARGGEPRQIGESWGGLAWSPDGKYLVITEILEGLAQSRLALIPIEGGPSQLISPPPTPNDSRTVIFEGDPRFSRDGKFLAFVRSKSDTNADLYVLDLKTRAIRRLTEKDSMIKTFEWTADSQEIIFSSDVSTPRRVWRLALAGGEPTPVDLFPFDVDSLAVHPTGKMIAFTQSGNDSVISISRLSPPSASQSPRPCSINSSVEDHTARFSPDGKWVVFHSTRTGFHELWLARPDCTEVRQLTQLRSVGLGSPRWSPDGKWIAFDHHTGGSSEIFTIRFDGRELRQLTNSPFHDQVPSWSSDGAWVYFSSGRTSRNQIWKVPAAGGTAVQVTFKGGFESIESTDGRTLYYTHLDQFKSLDFATGVEAPVPELSEVSVDRHWDLTRRGLFYAPIQSDDRSQLHRFDLTTRRITPLFALEKTFPKWLPRFAVSLDEELLATYYFEYRLGDILVLKEPTK